MIYILCNKCYEVVAIYISIFQNIKFMIRYLLDVIFKLYWRIELLNYRMLLFKMIKE